MGDPDISLSPSFEENSATKQGTPEEGEKKDASDKGHEANPVGPKSDSENKNQEENSNEKLSKQEQPQTEEINGSRLTESDKGICELRVEENSDDKSKEHPKPEEEVKTNSDNKLEEQQKIEKKEVEEKTKSKREEEVAGDQLSEAEVPLKMNPNEGQTMDEEDPAYAALRGKTNTPASVFTEFTDGREVRTVPNRPSAGVRTQEAFHRKGVDLISARCGSSAKMVSTEPLMGVKDPPPGFGAPRVFFIHQRRPRPMTPLKVWRGYHGNVYFEPMKINQASMKEHQMEVNLPPMSRCSGKLQSVIAQTRWNPEHVVRYRQNRHMLTPVTQETPPSQRYKNQPQPVLMMDREALARDPENLQILRTLESTGTLRVQSSAETTSGEAFGSSSPRTAATAAPTGRSHGGGQRMDKAKVCRGSVARKLVMFRNLMIPLMQDQMNKTTPTAPTDTPAVELAPQPRETPIKLPSISPKSSERSLRAK